MNEIQLFYDHKQQGWKQKKLNLKKIPMKYRCPSCGKILVKAKNREGYVQRYQERDPVTWIWSWKERVLNREDDLFERDIELGFYGGVCGKCWLSGLGKYSKTGKLFAWGMSKDFKKFAAKLEEKDECKAIL